MPHTKPRDELAPSCSFDDLVGKRKQRGRNFEVERLGGDQLLHEAIGASDENRNRYRRGLGHIRVTSDQRQRQRGRFIAEPSREVRRGLHLADRRRRRDDDAGSVDRAGDRTG